ALVALSPADRRPGRGVRPPDTAGNRPTSRHAGRGPESAGVGHFALYPGRFGPQQYQQPRPPRPDRRKPMAIEPLSIGVCSWSLQVKSVAELKGFLDRLGIDVVQIACGDPHHASW